jgi:hypothetical protein
VTFVVSAGYDVVAVGEATLVVSIGDDVGCGDLVVSTGDDVGSAVVLVSTGDVVTVASADVAGLVVVVGDGTPPAAEVAAMATVPAPSTPTATAAATMTFRDRSTAGIPGMRMGCPLDSRV